MLEFHAWSQAGINRMEQRGARHILVAAAIRFSDFGLPSALGFRPSDFSPAAFPLA
jgi:hypothetical protein